MRKNLICLLYLLIFGSFVHAAKLVNAPIINMYQIPSESASVVSQAIYGTKVKVLPPSERSTCKINTKIYYGWYCIQTPDHYFGWVKSSTIRKNSSYYRNITNKPENYLTTTNIKTYVYQDNSTSNYKPIMALPFDTKLLILSQPNLDNKRWIKIQLIDGFSGWIQRGAVHIGKYHLSMNEMLKLTPMFIGLPYTWGGSSSFGFDCSGFTQTMYKIIGIKLLRDARLQANQNNAITVLTRKQLQRDQFNKLNPGDLLFFGHNKRITHVGLYLGKYKGKHHQFIDSSVSNNQGMNAPILKTENLSAKFWRSIFIVAKHYSR